MRQKTDFWERVATRLDIPREALPGGFGMTLSGRSSLSVRGCRRILSYDPRAVRLLLCGAVLAVEGEELLCTSFGAGTVTLTGRVDTLRFEEVTDAD